MDRVVASSWKLDAMGGGFQSGGGRRLGNPEPSEANDFVWQRGKAEVRLRRDADDWCVIYSDCGRLIGPRRVLYEARHKRGSCAAYDVMARVIRVCQDEEEGVQAGRAAATWIQTIGGRNEGDAHVESR